MGGSAPPGVPPVPKILPPVLPPPITGGSTLKSHNLAPPPHFRGEHSKISERNSPRCSPPHFRGEHQKFSEFLQDTPKFSSRFARKSVEKLDFLPLKIAKFSLRFARKRYQKPQFTLENRKNFLRASREKYHFYLLKNTQNPAQLYICSKHKEFAVNFFFKLWVYIFLNSKKINDLVIFKTLKIQGIYLVFRAKFLEYFRSKNLISMISMIRIHDHMLPRDSPSAPPPISGGSTLKSQNETPPGAPPPISGGSTKNSQNSSRIPPNFLRASREKVLKNSIFYPWKSRNFLCASREKGTKNLNLPLKTAKIFFALRAKNIIFTF